MQFFLRCIYIRAYVVLVTKQDKNSNIVLCVVFLIAYTYYAQNSPY